MALEKQRGMKMFGVRKKNRLDFLDVAAGGLAVCAVVLAAVLIALLISNQKPDPEPVAQPVIQEKPVLYVTAVSPYIFLNTKDGLKLTVLDGRLNEAEFKFSDGKEAARFLNDISGDFEINDYTGAFNVR